jgi:hypothetical protein
MQALNTAGAAVLPTSAGLAELSAALATGCSVAEEVCRSAAENACGAWVARSNPGSARSSIWLMPEEREVIWQTNETTSTRVELTCKVPIQDVLLSCVSYGERTGLLLMRQLQVTVERSVIKSGQVLSLLCCAQCHI